MYTFIIIRKPTGGRAGEIPLVVVFVCIGAVQLLRIYITLQCYKIEKRYSHYNTNALESKFYKFLSILNVYFCQNCLMPCLLFFIIFFGGFLGLTELNEPIYYLPILKKKLFKG